MAKKRIDVVQFTMKGYLELPGTKQTKSQRQIAAQAKLEELEKTFTAAGCVFAMTSDFAQKEIDAPDEKAADESTQGTV